MSKSSVSIDEDDDIVVNNNHKQKAMRLDNQKWIVTFLSNTCVDGEEGLKLTSGDPCNLVCIAKEEDRTTKKLPTTRTEGSSQATPSV